MGDKTIPARRPDAPLPEIFGARRSQIAGNTAADPVLSAFDARLWRRLAAALAVGSTILKETF